MNIANTTSTPVGGGWKFGGWAGNHEMVGKGYARLKIVKLHPFVPLYFHISHKAAKSMAKLIS